MSFNTRWLLTGALSLAFSFPANAGAMVAEDGAESVRISGSARARYEHLSDAYRANRDGSDQQLSTVIRALAEFDAGPVTVGIEAFDARGFLTDEGGVLSASAINTAEILQAYADFTAGENTRVRVGRFTSRLGSQRLSVANSFRNWPNVFDGVRVQHQAGENTTVRAFYTIPVTAQPRDRAALLDNTAQADEAAWGTHFWGVHMTRSGLGNNVTGEFYVLGLHEDPGSDVVTPGIRLTRPKGVGQVDMDLEGIYQFGEYTSGGNTFDVSAGTIHAAVGYTFDAPWQPRLSGQFAWASGDDDPLDNEWNRFDTLYGGRRFDFGQTGIFGPLSRQNLVTAGVRLEVRNGPVNFGILAEEARLASDTDRWGPARLRDSSGTSGDRIGFVIDTRFQWWIRPRELPLEAGAATLRRGDFAENAPNAPTGSDPVYSYVMLTRKF
ncbi:alginate export family protein [Maricaulis sp.]|uniref:alginate export family protein n=1 Tax=Maricaulis sp. TaxID=1486257 RepID=UPI0026061C96|nr:alginate export family protein [Maricaulis sp.]